jgi:hypothetical protein
MNLEGVSYYKKYFLTIGASTSISQSAFLVGETASMNVNE